MYKNYYKPNHDFTGLVTDKNGTITYYVSGKLHRVDGPTIEYAEGHKEWWLHGKRHRVDGPAIEYANGHKVWYYNDELISYDQNYTLEDFKLKIFK